MYFFFSFLCDSWLGNGSSCLLEVVASSAGEKGVHMDLRTAIKWLSRFMDLCAHSVFVYGVDPLVVLVSVA